MGDCTILSLSPQLELCPPSVLLEPGMPLTQSFPQLTLSLSLPHNTSLSTTLYSHALQNGSESSDLGVKNILLPSGFTGIHEENESIRSPSSYQSSYPTTPLDEARGGIPDKNESSAYFPQISTPDGHSVIRPSNLDSIPSLQFTSDGVEIEPIFAANPQKSKSDDSNEDHVVASTQLPDRHEPNTNDGSTSGQPASRKMNIQFLLQSPMQIGNEPDPPTSTTAESNFLAEAGSSEGAAISLDPSSATEYSSRNDVEIVSDNSGVLPLDRSSMPSLRNMDPPSTQIAPRLDFFENFILPAVTRRTEIIPNLHWPKTPSHWAVPMMTSDLTTPRAPNATAVSPSGNDLPTSFSRSVLRATIEANETLVTAAQALDPKDLERGRPSVFNTYRPLVPPRKAQAISPARRAKSKVLLDPTIKIKDKYAQRKPWSFLTPTPIVKPSRGSPSHATRSAAPLSPRPLARSSATASITPTTTFVFSGPNASFLSGGPVLDNHSASTKIPHVLAQIDDAIPQSVKLRTGSMLAPATRTITSAPAQPIPIPYRKAIEIDYAEMPSVDISIRDSLFLQPQASRKDSSKSPKVVMNERGRRGKPGIFRQSARLRRDVLMSKPIFLGTPLEIPGSPPLEDMVPNHSFVPRERDSLTASASQEISIIVSPKVNLPEIRSFGPLPAPRSPAPQLRTVGSNETNLGPLNLPRNHLPEMSTPIITRPSSPIDIDMHDVPEYSSGGTDVFAAGTKHPLFVPRDIRSRVIFQPVVSPLPTIPITLGHNKPDIQPSAERIVLTPISPWRSAIPHRTNLAKLPGIHTILSLPETS